MRRRVRSLLVWVAAGLLTLSLSVAEVGEVKEVQLLDPDVIGLPASSPMKLLLDKRSDAVEPCSVYTDTKRGKYDAAILDQKGSVTFGEVRAQLDRLYPTSEDAWALSEDATYAHAHWRVVDKSVSIHLGQYDQSVFVTYLPWPPPG